MKAKDLIITTIEAEEMFKAHREGAIKYEELTEKERADTNAIPVKPYKNLIDFTNGFMRDLARISHGDIVLMEGNKEIKREKANFQQPKMFVNEEVKKKQQ